MQGVAQSAPVFRPSNNPDLSGLSRATEEQIGAIGLESRNIYSGRHVELLQNLPRFHPGLSEDFFSLLPQDERARPLDAYWRRILDPDPVVHGPAAMEAHDANYVGGDINGGVEDIRQLIFRPWPSLDPYRVEAGLYLCSSSTPPGGGVHGMCGMLAAQSVLRHELK